MLSFCGASACVAGRAELLVSERMLSSRGCRYWLRPLAGSNGRLLLPPPLLFYYGWLARCAASRAGD